jgi:hypothetical protein
MPDNAIRIEGLRELEWAFKLYGRGLDKGLREAVEAGAEVVRPDASALTATTIQRSEIDWTAMRAGVKGRVGFVAPVQRGTYSRRDPRYRRGQRFVDRVVTQALEPALEQNVPRVEQEFEDALADLARMWSRV